MNDAETTASVERGRPKLSNRLARLLGDPTTDTVSVILTLHRDAAVAPGLELFTATWAVGGRAILKARGVRLEQALMLLGDAVDQHRKKGRG